MEYVVLVVEDDLLLQKRYTDAAEAASVDGNMFVLVFAGTMTQAFLKFETTTTSGIIIDAVPILAGSGVSTVGSLSHLIGFIAEKGYPGPIIAASSVRSDRQAMVKAGCTIAIDKNGQDNKGGMPAMFAHILSATSEHPST